MRSFCCAVAVLVVLACGAPVARPDGGGGGFVFDTVSGGSAGGGSSGGGGSASGGSAAGGSAGGQASNDGGVCELAARPRTVTQLLSSFLTVSPSGLRPSGGLDARRRLFTLPAASTPSLRRLPIVQLVDAGTALPDGGARASVSSLAVEGTLPLGDLTASAFDETSGVLTGLYFSPTLQVEVVQLTLVDDRARLTIINQQNTLDAGTFTLQSMAGTSSRLGVHVGSSVATLTITGTQARWSDGQTLSAHTMLTTYDRQRDRVLSLYAVEFNGGQARWEPVVQERAPTAGVATTLPMTGSVLPSVPTSEILPPRFLVYDRDGQRLLVSGERLDRGFIRSIVLEADLARGQWREARDTGRSITAPAPFVVDRAERQLFMPDLSTLSLAPGREFEPSRVALNGALPPEPHTALSSATRRADGLLIALPFSGPLVSFDEATSSWARLPVARPAEHGSGAVVVWDPIGQRVLVAFGQSAGAASSTVSALSADGTQLTALSTSGQAPSGRTSPGVAVVGRTLVVAGGASASGQRLGDVFALDLDTLRWRKVADVTPRRFPALASAGNTVTVVGGEPMTGGFVSVVERVDLASGAVTTLPTTGTPPSAGRLVAFGRGVAGFEASNRYARAQWFELTLSEATARWDSTTLEVTNMALSGTVGVERGCGQALFVGPSSFLIEP